MQRVLDSQAGAEPQQQIFLFSRFRSFFKMSINLLSCPMRFNIYILVKVWQFDVIKPEYHSR